MTVTMYGWLLVSAMAVAVLVWWFERDQVGGKMRRLRKRARADEKRAQAEWCYDITKSGFDTARAIRVGTWCECSVPVPWLDANVSFCCNECGRDVDPDAMEMEKVHRADWQAFDEMRDPAERAQDAYEDYLDDAEDAAQEAYERRLRAEALTKSEL